MSITIRKGTEQDIPQVFELIKELALFEHAPEQVTNTPERMLVDGFGENPIYGCVVAEENGLIIGISIYYFRYSTWKGKRLYLEDIIVNAHHRGKGAGKLLFERTIEIAKETHCVGMTWQVLDWNQAAIDFYKKYTSNLDDEWVNCHLEF